MSLRVLNPNAEVLNKSAALHMNINAAKGLQDVLKTNLGPKGTIKMYSLPSPIASSALFSSRFFLLSLFLIYYVLRLVGGAGEDRRCRVPPAHDHLTTGVGHRNDAVVDGLHESAAVGVGENGS